jgi:hypothetical protein
MGQAMIEPSLAVQTAIRQHLIDTNAASDLVPDDHIRAGSTRPDKLPAIMIGNGTVQMHGRAANGQYVASVFLDLHVWAIENGLDLAKEIGGRVGAALLMWPAGEGFEFDEFKHTRAVWPRDPDPKYGHGVLSVECVIRWKL